MRNDITPDLNMLEEQMARLKRQLTAYNALVEMHKAIESQPCELRIGTHTYGLSANDKVIKKLLASRMKSGDKHIADTLLTMANIVGEMQAEVWA